MANSIKIKMTGERAVPDDVRTVVEYVQFLRHEFVYKHIQGLLRPNNRVLEIGFGEGYGTKMLSQACEEIIGIDIKKEVIEYAREKYGSTNCIFQHYDGNEIPFRPDSFDVVVTFQVIEHIKDDKHFISEIYRVLKQSGFFYVTTPNRATRLKPGEKPWNRFHVREYYAKELQDLLKIRFLQAEVFGVNAIDEIRKLEFERMKRAGLMGLALKLGVRRILPQSLDPILARIIGAVRGHKKIGKSGQELKSRYSINDFWIEKDKVDDSLDLIGYCQKSPEYEKQK